MPSRDEIVADPAWLPHRYDAGSRMVEFLHVPKEDHRSVTFLADEYLGPRPRQTVPLSELVEPRLPPSAPIHFLCHSAFCGSTLVARSLDIEGHCFALKEPRILNDLAFAVDRGSAPHDALRPVLRLLARRFTPGEAIIVKPSNEANILASFILDGLEESRGVLLSSSLEDFLLSVAQKGMWGRIWARRLHAQMRPWARRDPGFSAPEIFQQTDLQIAAMVWIIHRSHFADLLARFPDRLASLLADRLIGNLPLALARIGKHLRLTVAEPAAWAAAAAGEEHSKQRGRRFNAEVRQAERAAVRAAHREEIEMCVSWATSVADHIGLSLDLERPLLTG